MTTKKNDGFTARTIAAMAHELAQAEQAVRNVREMYVALAREHGVPITTAQV